MEKKAIVRALQKMEGVVGVERLEGKNALKWKHYWVTYEDGVAMRWLGRKNEKGEVELKTMH